MATVSDEPKADQPEPPPGSTCSIGTKFPDLFGALAAPFDPQEVRYRTQGNRQLAYITARTAMNRLDSVLGPENWWDEYAPGEKSVLCRLSICLPDGHVLTKCDAGGYAGMADSGDDDKSGYSDGFKRAAVKFGVGRYLYRDGVPDFASESHGAVGDHPETSQPHPHSASRESMPSQGRGPTTPQRENGRQYQGGSGGGGQQGGNSAPRSGRALFAWCKDQEQKHEVGLLKYLNGWAKLQEFPARMVDWDSDQVSQGYAEAVRKIQSLSTGHEDAPAN